MSDETITGPINFTVSLDPNNGSPVLKVAGDNKIGKSGNKQLLVWKLGIGLENAEFVEGTACRPGFEWLSWPPPAETIFDKAERDDKDKKKLVINDTHPSADSDGRWYYKLRVQMLPNGPIYETPMTAPEPFDVDEPCDTRRLIVGNNPVIINR